jgi:hypothetical protein
MCLIRTGLRRSAESITLGTEWFVRGHVVNDNAGAGMAAGDAAGGTAGPRFGVRSMYAPLRRVLLRRPSVTGDFTAAAWRAPYSAQLADTMARELSLDGTGQLLGHRLPRRVPGAGPVLPGSPDFLRASDAV